MMKQGRHRGDATTNQPCVGSAGGSGGSLCKATLQRLFSLSPVISLSTWNLCISNISEDVEQMTDWAEQYLAALQARDKVEKANFELYDYCARLADQKAELENRVRNGQPADTTAQAPSPPPPLAGLRRITSPPLPESTSVMQLRQDLIKAQQERTELQSRLESTSRELDIIKAKSKTDTKKLNQLSLSVSQLTLKLKDRDAELKGKAKLLEDVQDEHVTLNLQLNMAEEQSQKLRKENKDLVDRWMARMGKEADRMNDESQFA